MKRFGWTTALPAAVFVAVLAGSPVSTLEAGAPEASSARGEVAVSGVAGKVHSGQLSDLAKLVEKHRGRPVLLNFWATWCAPCIEEIPTLRKAAERYADTGLVVLGVSLDGLSMENQRAARKKVRLWVAKHGIPWETFYYEGDFEPISEAYDLPGPIPHSIILDEDGDVRQSLIGVIPADVLLRRIGEALGRQPEPESVSTPE